MPPVHVVFLFGSANDLHYLWHSRLLDALDGAGVTYEVTVCSAHRNAQELAEYVSQTVSRANAYVCAAGWAAALPGAVKALLLRSSLAPVFGIALSSEAYPDAMDAQISIQRIPSLEVIFGGVDTAGFDAITEPLIEQANAYNQRNLGATPSKPSSPETRRQSSTSLDRRGTHKRDVGCDLTWRGTTALQRVSDDLGARPARSRRRNAPTALAAAGSTPMAPTRSSG